MPERVGQMLEERDDNRAQWKQKTEREIREAWSIMINDKINNE